MITQEKAVTLMACNSKIAVCPGIMRQHWCRLLQCAVIERRLSMLIAAHVCHAECRFTGLPASDSCSSARLTISDISVSKINSVSITVLRIICSFKFLLYFYFGKLFRFSFSFSF